MQVGILVTTQSGQAQLFKYQPNGHTKPVKPSLNIAVAADINQKETVQQIPILAGHLTEDEKLLLAYGSYFNLTFEKVMPDFSDKVQCLIRSERLDTKKSKERKEEAISKVKPTAIEEDVEYLAPGNIFVIMYFHGNKLFGSMKSMKNDKKNKIKNILQEYKFQHKKEIELPQALNYF